VRRSSALVVVLLGACWGERADAPVVELSSGVTKPAAQPREGAEPRSKGAPAPKVGPPPEPLPPSLRCEAEEADSTCFVSVPGGSFWRGAQATAPAERGYDEHARPDEAPVHEVKLSPFRIQRVEVSTSSYRRCVDDGWCTTEALDTVTGMSNWSDPESRAALNGVSWFGAERYCAWLGARLPTEAEWEYAARGTNGRPFPWGSLPRCGVQVQVGVGLQDQSEDEPQLTCAASGPVPYGDLRGRSAFDLSGMAGNVWEWTADWYAAEAYRSAAPSDPKGPTEGTLRVQRGGGWSSTEVWELRSAARGAMDPTAKLPDVGFRCARDETP
jgi:formylglycine-generating enzyme required for sulfatase activity